MGPPRLEKRLEKLFAGKVEQRPAVDGRDRRECDPLGPEAENDDAPGGNGKFSDATVAHNSVEPRKYAPQQTYLLGAWLQYQGVQDVAITFPLISSAVIVIEVATLLGLTTATAVIALISS